MLGSGSSPSSIPRIDTQRSFERATCQEARGQRSSACFSFQEARWSGASSRRRPARRARGSRPARRAARAPPRRRAARETKHSYIPSPETGSISPAASPTSSTRSPAMRGPGRRSGSRWPRSCSRSSGSIPCASHARFRCSRSFGPSLCQPPTPTFAWSPLGKTQRVPARNVGELEHEPARVPLRARRSGT